MDLTRLDPETRQLIEKYLREAPEDAKDELAQALKEIEEIKKKSAGVPVWAWKIGPKLRDELKQLRRAYREVGSRKKSQG